MQETRAAVLAELEESPVSGPELAARLDISRAAVWKHIEALREAGFDIPSTDSGYRLDSIPEFAGPALEYGLTVPFDIEFHDSIGSTNARARELAGEGANRVAVVADEQTGGRGRLDREWHSPSGGIWLSLLFRPDLPPAQAPLFTLAAAVATARALSETGIESSIKWPNDVLIDGKKVAGILTEMEGEADRISWVIVGIGLNANVDTDTLPASAEATSLQAIAGPIDRRSLTQTLLAEFWSLTENSEEILDAWRSYSSTLGKRVRVETPTGSVVGDAVDITHPGGLVIDGEKRTTVTAGDCEHLRPVEE